MRWIYYKMRQLNFITKCDDFITKCDSYYKMRQIYHKMRQVLQNATLLQNATIVESSTADELSGKNRGISKDSMSISKRASPSQPSFH